MEIDKFGNKKILDVKQKIQVIVVYEEEISTGVIVREVVVNSIERPIPIPYEQ